MDLAPPPADAAPVPAPPVDDDPPDRIVAGVAALLADRLAVDALWIRIAFVLLALVGGVGLLLYGALWLVFLVGADPGRRWARLAGGAILVVGLPFLLTQGLRFLDGAVAVLALLAGLAVALWQPRRPLSSVPVILNEPGAAGPAGGATDPSGAPLDDPASTRRLPRLPRRAPRPPSILGRAALGIALLAAAIGALVDQSNGGRMHPEQWLGAAAAVCGIGLLVGAVAGRALWLAVPAVLFAGVGFAAGEAARVGVRPSALLGDEWIYVGRGEPGGWERREHVVLGSVQVSIDGPPLSPVAIDARAAIGDVTVWTSDDVTVEVRAWADHGHVDVLDRRVAGGTVTIGPEGPADVVVDARVGRGDVHVAQYPHHEENLPPATMAPLAGSVTYVSEGIELTSRGHVVLAGGEVVIGEDDTVLTGASYAEDRVTVLTTSLGDFRLLPGGLLLTPYGGVVDLHAIRDEVLGTTASTAPPPGGSAPPAVTTVPTGATVTPRPVPEGSAVGTVPTEGTGG